MKTSNIRQNWFAVLSIATFLLWAGQAMAVIATNTPTMGPGNGPPPPPPQCPPPPPASAGDGAGAGGPSCPDDSSEESGDDSGSDDDMTRWYVSEPYMALWLHDSPLFYHLADRSKNRLRVTYNSQAAAKDHSLGGFGANWECTWISYLDKTNSSDTVSASVSGGLSTTLHADGSPNYENSTRLSHPMAFGSLRPAGLLADPVPDDNAWLLQSPYGETDIYGYPRTLSGVTRYYLTNRTDAYGRSMVFDYENHVNPDSSVVTRLKEVIDIDGRTNTIAYTNTAFPDLITSVTDPYNRVARFFYDVNGRLTNITDMAGIASSFTYLSSSDNTITNLHTPYGDTGFAFFSGSNATSALNRAVEITEPTLEKQLYVYRDASSATMIGTYLSKDSDTQHRNSYHWNRRQYAEISSTGKTNCLDMPDADYGKASLKHWLRGDNINNQTTVVGTLSASAGPIVPSESDPSFRPNGVTYSYLGQTGSASIGTQKIIAGVYYQTGDKVEYERNDWGRPTQIIYYRNSSPVSYTNEFNADGRILQKVWGPHGELVRGYGYDPVLTNLLTSATNAAGDVIRYTYDANIHLTSVTHPGGLFTANLYYTSGAHAGFLQSSVDLGFGTNYFDYVNGDLSLKTNELGLVTTYTHDNLDRLTSITYPDSTIKSNVYTILDLTATKDRDSNWTYFGYNSLQQLIARTNANNHVITYDYCGCGALSQIAEMNGGTPVITQYSYDLAGRRTNALYPDGYSINYVYGDNDHLQRLEDGSGRAVEISYADYDNIASIGRSLLPNISPERNFFEHWFDDYGRLYLNVDANGIIITNGFDILDRITNRYVFDGYPSSYHGPETFAYSPLGMTNYTDMLGHQEWFGYDLLGRLVAKTNANTDFILYNYQIQNHALQLIDEKNHTNTWHYDEYGRTTNKVDALGNIVFTNAYDIRNRLTNRWTPAKGNTLYRYDVVNNLTNVDYPGTVMDINLQYDELNRLTNMVDVTGNTRFTYTAAGLLASEDGPWSDDTVNYVYDRRHRTQMSVQQPNSSPWVQNYDYDSYWRLQTLSSPAGSFGYTYYADGLGGLVTKTTYPTPGNEVNNSYDGFGRLLSTVFSGPLTPYTLNSHAYSYDDNNQRTQQVFTAGNSINYTYDNIGQLKTAIGQEANTTSRLNEQFGYFYDPAGNLTNRTMNALSQGFGVDNLNQLSSESRSGTLTVAGTTSSSATSVNVSDGTASGAADVYGDSTFAKSGFAVANGNNTYTAVAQDTYGRQDTGSITVNLPTSVSFHYDLNGNLTNDGNRVLEYDFENQLTNVYVATKWRSEFKYDGFGRRRIVREYTWQSSAWVQTNEVHYVYDRRLVVQERDANNQPLVTYTRGLDLSGSRQGAGGIGGLLARTDNGQKLAGSVLAHAYYQSDGSGNITTLINTNGAVMARYTYDPFGNILSKGGLLADANVYRFSSKEYHQNSGLSYYLYRYYDANLQRWINRDPINETGGINQYCFVLNNPIYLRDAFGLCGGAEEDNLDRELEREELDAARGTTPELEAEIDRNTEIMNEEYEELPPYFGKEPIMRALIPKPKPPQPPQPIPFAPQNINQNGMPRSVSYPLRPQYPPPTRPGENFQFNFDTSENFARSRAAGVRRARSEGFIDPGEIGHHSNSVQTHPHLAAEPSNIQGVGSFQEHLDTHGGDFRNPTTGPLCTEK